MNIQINTEKVSALDLEILRIIDVERERSLGDTLARLGDALGSIADLDRQVFNLKSELAVRDQEIANLRSRPAPMERKGSVSARILALFDADASLTAVDVMASIGSDNQAATYQALYALHKKGLLNKGGSRPVRFFLRKSGDPELRAALPPGSRVSVMR